jgi:hypothetical protein
VAVSYDDVVGYLSGWVGEPCSITGYLADGGDWVVTESEVAFARPERSGSAQAMFLSINLGSIEPGTFEGHAGNRAALLDDDGIEIGTLTLTRDSFVNAAFDARSGALHVGMSANTASPPLALVDEHEHARVLGRDAGGWMWSFSFSEIPGGDEDA